MNAPFSEPRRPTSQEVLDVCHRQVFHKLKPGEIEVFGLMIEWIAKHSPENLHAALYTTWVHFEAICGQHGRPDWLVEAERAQRIVPFKVGGM